MRRLSRFVFVSSVSLLGAACVADLPAIDGDAGPSGDATAEGATLDAPSDANVDAPNDATPPNSGVVAVFYGKLNPSSHDIATWTAAGQLETARSAHTAVIAGGNILVTGGLYSGAATGTNEDSYAAIAADGTVGSFSPASGGTKLTSNLFNHAAIGYLSTGSNPTFHLVVVGGDNVNAPGTKSAQSFIY